MSFRRYIASTVREGLDRVRRELGEDALILSNKRLGPGRIEIVAAASDSMEALVEDADRPGSAVRKSEPAREHPRSEDRDQTESFQDFIRRQAPTRTRQEPREALPRARASERSETAPSHTGVAMYNEVARVHAEPAAPSAAVSESASIAPAPATGRPPRAPVQSASPPAVFRKRAGDEAETPAPAEPAAVLEPATTAKSAPASTRPQVDGSPHVNGDDTRVMDELRSLRAALSDRIAALESNMALNRPPAPDEAAGQRHAASTRVMTRLLMSGFSPDLARRVATHAPATSDNATVDGWLHRVIAGNLRCAAATDGLLENQGAIALVGPTGAGKTTTVAKLAARFAVHYGAAQLGLVTLDSGRIGAHEQLRSYGRILGIPMHIAQDGATLRELLSSLQGKRLVLIDTCGLSQRDERMEEMLGALSAARFNMHPIRRVLVLNAASHSETLDEVARAWRAPDAAGAILTKMDEAARIGGAIDCLLRYRMMLFGLTNGQRVPEDWHPAGARLIAHVALKPSTSPFSLGDEEARALARQLQRSVPA